jgi:hypothetical protein
MNDRIKKLMLEAGFAAPELAGRANLLVELIARDICKIIKGQKIAKPLAGYQDWENGYNASVKHAVEQIKRQYQKEK